MKPPADFWRSGRGFEWLFAAGVVTSVIYTIWYLMTYYYLPPPYFYEPSDIYADWFNTAYWARDPGTYDVWTTLYPPLSFVMLRVVGLEQCYPRVRAYESSPGLAVRDCDWLGVAGIWGFWLASVVIMYLVLRKWDKSRAIPRTICVGLGWPLLNGIERGNLILMAFPFFLLATMPLLKSTKWRWFFAGMAVNLKVYLIAPLLTPLFKRRWRWVEGAMLGVVMVYLVSFAILGRGTPFEILRNITSWSNKEFENILDFWPATTYQGLRSVLTNENATVPIGLLIGSRMVEYTVLFIDVLLRVTQAFLLVAFAAAWLRPEVVTRYRLYLLGILIALVTSEAGGYTPVFMMALLMMEPWKGFGRIFSICACYLLALSADIKLEEMMELTRTTYYRDSQVISATYLTVWPFVRPLLIQAVAIAMSCVTIREVWMDVRFQGWASRWRFRGDAPMLPGIKHPTPPGQG